MVITIGRATCNECYAQGVTKIDSGQGTNGATDCEMQCLHWETYSEEYTTLGWFLGMNAEIIVYFNAICNRCERKTWARHKYWGWPSGGGLRNVLSCCCDNRKITITTSVTDHWIKIFFDIFHPVMWVVNGLGLLAVHVPLSGEAKVIMKIPIREARGYKVNRLYRYSNQALILSKKASNSCLPLFIIRAADYWGKRFTQSIDGVQHAWVVLETRHRETNDNKWFCVVMGGTRKNPNIEFADFDEKDNAIEHGASFASCFGIFEIPKNKKDYINKIYGMRRIKNNNIYVSDIFIQVKNEFDGKRWAAIGRDNFLWETTNCVDVSDYIMNTFGK